MTLWKLRGRCYCHPWQKKDYFKASWLYSVSNQHWKHLNTKLPPSQLDFLTLLHLFFSDRTQLMSVRKKILIISIAALLYLLSHLQIATVVELDFVNTEKKMNDFWVELLSSPRGDVIDRNNSLLPQSPQIPRGLGIHKNKTSSIHIKNKDERNKMPTWSALTESK